MYVVKFRPGAERAFFSLPTKMQGRIGARIEALASNPRPFGCRKMSGLNDLYRIRVGEYRVVYQIRDAELVVLVVRIGPRASVYEGL